MKDLEISCSSFVLEAEDPINLPRFKGSALRGGFGHAFKKTACVLKSQDCGECILKESCAYSYVFETPPPEGSAILRKYPRAPHPFVLEPPEDNRPAYEPGDTISFRLLLMGPKAIGLMSFFVYSFMTLGRMGLGRGRGRFSLKEVRGILPAGVYSSGQEAKDTATLIFDGTSENIRASPLVLSWHQLLEHRPPAADSITLEFITPTRIRYQGRYTLQLDFQVLIRNLLRRISTLHYFHAGEPLEVDFRGLIRAAAEVSLEDSNLGWFDWERYSARQETRMKLGGFVGSVSFRGDLEPFWPYLVLGELIHVGKGTSFGLGRYEIKISQEY